MQTVARAMDAIPEGDLVASSRLRMAQIRREMFDLLESDGVRALQEYRNRFRLLLAYAVLAGDALGEEIKAGTELARLEGWRVTKQTSRPDEFGDDEVIEAMRESAAGKG